MINVLNILIALQNTGNALCKHFKKYIGFVAVECHRAV